MLYNAVLRVIHPLHYKTSLNCLLRLHNTHHESALENWGTVFNALSVISNRETPYHRDNQSRHQWYDLVTTFGTYPDARLSLPGLGIELPYHSGTISAFSGRVLRHGVREAEGRPGDRLCLVYYMRESVQDRLGGQAGEWVRVNDWN